MSHRGLIPVVLAVGFGVANGYITFNPAFQQLEVEKLKDAERHEAADLGPNMIEIPVNDKGQTEDGRATTSGSGNARENTPSPPLDRNGNPRPRSWWPFAGQSR